MEGTRSQKAVEADGVLEIEGERVLEGVPVGVLVGVKDDETDGKAPTEREAVTDDVLDGVGDGELVLLLELEIVLEGVGVSVQAASIETSLNPNTQLGAAGLQDAPLP